MADPGTDPVAEHDAPYLVGEKAAVHGGYGIVRMRAERPGETLGHMYAIRQYEFGPPDTLRYEEAPDPQPAAGQVRVAVAAAGVHLIDTTIRRGTDAGPFPLPELPMTPGREVAGTVDAVGDGVDRGWLGRRVVAHLGQASGGYAQFALAVAERLHAIPGQLDADVAVAMIGTGRTAMAVLDATPIGEQDAVLVTAAAGGLGNLLVQAAVRAGAYVCGVAGGPEKVELVAEAGAHLALDYRRDDWAGRLRSALGDRELTVVLDGVGGPVGRSAMELLGTGGWLTMFGWSAGEPIALTAQDLFRQRLTVTAAVGARLLRHPDDMRRAESRALEAAAEGRWKPLLTRFALAEAAAAHAAMEERRTVGKTVLVP